MKIKNKTKLVGARVTGDQYRWIVKEAKIQALRVSEFIRLRVLSQR